jgi:hypothetical protein
MGPRVRKHSEIIKEYYRYYVGFFRVHLENQFVGLQVFYENKKKNAASSAN